MRQSIHLTILCAVLVLMTACTNCANTTKVKADIATAKADYQRGLDYDRGWQMRIAEHYYKKAFEGFSVDPAQDWGSYGDAGYRWA